VVTGAVVTDAAGSAGAADAAAGEEAADVAADVAEVGGGWTAGPGVAGFASAGGVAAADENSGAEMSKSDGVCVPAF
jgi:hypothetical protein